MRRATRPVPRRRALARWHWSDKPADLEHELEQLLHDCDDEDLVAITAQVLAALRAMPEGATFYATDGEPAGDEESEPVAESADGRRKGKCGKGSQAPGSQ